MTNMNLRCALDLDNVVVDIIQAAKRLLLSVHDAADHDIIETGVYGAPLAWADARRPPLVFDFAFWDRDGLLASCQPLPGAFEAVHLLNDLGFLAGYVSRRTPMAHGVTRAWLEVYGFPTAELVHVGSNDPATHSHLCKSEICHRLGATILIDDSEHEAARVMTAGITPILVDHSVGLEARRSFHAQNPAIFLAEDVLHAARHLSSNARKAA